jgi:dipeptidase
MFVIRAMDLADVDGPREHFLLSPTAREVAGRVGLWHPGTPFDFAALFSAGEARHRFYSGRRQWRGLSLFAPSLQLSPWYDDPAHDAATIDRLAISRYDDLLFPESGEPAYPFSVPVEAQPLQRQDLMRIMRDTYEGTEFDLSTQPAAGPFGVTDRWDGANGCKAKEQAEDGAFERPIGVYRMAYSYIGEPHQPDHHSFHFAPHSAQTAVYLPIVCSAAQAPAALCTGTIRALDRLAAYWAFRVVKHTAQGLVWSRCLGLIAQRQRLWEGQAAAIIDGALSPVDTAAAADALAAEVVADWWQLNDEMLLRFGDGWEYEWREDGESLSRPLAYPATWLKTVGFFRTPDGAPVEGRPPPPPANTVWDIEKKLLQGPGAQLPQV